MIDKIVYKARSKINKNSIICSNCKCLLHLLLSNNSKLNSFKWYENIYSCDIKQPSKVVGIFKNLSAQTKFIFLA